jgi:hypothetical protein
VFGHGEGGVPGFSQRWVSVDLEGGIVADLRLCHTLLESLIVDRSCQAGLGRAFLSSMVVMTTDRRCWGEFLRYCMYMYVESIDLCDILYYCVFRCIEMS